MSIEELDLSELLSQTLEKNGSLARIRAQLRANVYLALQEDLKVENGDYQNSKIDAYLRSAEGRIMFCIVKDFLQFFDLDYTMSVYAAESHQNSSCCEYSKQSLIEHLGIRNVDVEDSVAAPVLWHLIRACGKLNRTFEEDPTSFNQPYLTTTSKGHTVSSRSPNGIHADMLNKTVVLKEATDNANNSDDVGMVSSASDASKNDNSADLDQYKSRSSASSRSTTEHGDRQSKLNTHSERMELPASSSNGNDIDDVCNTERYKDDFVALDEISSKSNSSRNVSQIPSTCSEQTQNVSQSDDVTPSNEFSLTALT